MGKSLYRSYRSTSLDEIVGQDHITKTLKNALKNKAIAHAYLFSGPRGVGKTSIARILAYAVNEEPYKLENTHLDIIEIDAASNRRIDEIREIRDKVRIAPARGKYKVYIIDEVHMLTREAFNALLKTLEEPPEHVIFILATTESHKLPETIISRCIHFAFRSIPSETISEHLQIIAEKEKIQIDNEAIQMLSEHSNGSFRDAISLLEQVKFMNDKISDKDVSAMLGLAPKSAIIQIVGSIEKGHIKSVLKFLNSAYVSGSTPNVLSHQIHDYLLDSLKAGKNTKLSSGDILEIQNNLLDVPGSSQPKIKLEIVLSKATIEQNHEIPITPATNEDTSPNNSRNEFKNLIATQDQTSVKIKNKAHNKVDVPDNWQSFLEKLKEKNNTLYSVVRMAQMRHEAGLIYLEFKFNFHKKQLDESKNRKIVESILSESIGETTQIVTQLEEQNKEKTIDNTDIQNLSNIFGKTEVLES